MARRDSNSVSMSSQLQAADCSCSQRVCMCCACRFTNASFKQRTSLLAASTRPSCCALFVQVLLAGADPLLGIPDDMCIACPYQDCQVSAIRRMQHARAAVGLRAAVAAADADARGHLFAASSSRSRSSCRKPSIEPGHHSADPAITRCPHHLVFMRSRFAQYTHAFHLWCRLVSLSAQPAVCRCCHVAGAYGA